MGGSLRRVAIGSLAHSSSMMMSWPDNSRGGDNWSGSSVSLLALSHLSPAHTRSLCVFEDAHTLPCSHRFCLECITGCFRSSKRQECPLCKVGKPNHDLFPLAFSLSDRPWVVFFGFHSEYWTSHCIAIDYEYSVYKYWFCDPKSKRCVPCLFPSLWLCSAASLAFEAQVNTIRVFAG